MSKSGSGPTHPPAPSRGEVGRHRRNRLGLPFFNKMPGRPGQKDDQKQRKPESRERVKHAESFPQRHRDHDNIEDEDKCAVDEGGLKRRKFLVQAVIPEHHQDKRDRPEGGVKRDRGGIGEKFEGVFHNQAADGPSDDRERNQVDYLTHKKKPRNYFVSN